VAGHHRAGLRRSPEPPAHRLERPAPSAKPHLHPPQSRQHRSRPHIPARPERAAPELHRRATAPPRRGQDANTRERPLPSPAAALLQASERGEPCHSPTGPAPPPAVEERDSTIGCPTPDRRRKATAMIRCRDLQRTSRGLLPRDRGTTRKRSVRNSRQMRAKPQVPGTGLEPARLAAVAPKTTASAIPPPRQVVC
jgi:hypothetical protein